MTYTREQRQEVELGLQTGRAGIVSGFQIRDVDTASRKIQGRAVPYDVEIDLGWYFESMAAGVFTKSIKESARALPLLLFHDPRSLDTAIGKTDSWQENARGADGIHGLEGVWEIDPGEEEDRALAKVESGSLAFMSVGFQPKAGELGSEYRWDDDDNLHVRRKEARLLEVSLTPTPAYADAVVSKARHQVIPGRPRLERWQRWARREGIIA